MARDAGGEIESDPEEYDHAPGYRAVIVHDPDGSSSSSRVAALETRDGKGSAA